MDSKSRRAVIAALAAPASLLAAAAAAAAPTPPPAPTVTYRVMPEFQNGALAAFSVEMAAPGSPGGIDILDMPESFGERPAITDLQAGPAKVTDLGGGRLKIVHAPGAPVRIRYRVLPEVAADPAGEPHGPVIRPDWFVARGDMALLVPEAAPQARARVTLAPFPAGWTTATSLTGAVPLSQVDDSLLIGGRNYRVVERTVTGAPLRVAYPARLEPLTGPLLDRAAKVVAAERAFWRAPGASFLIGVVPLTDDGQYGGRGLSGGFELFLGGGDLPADTWLHTIAHENMHSWISRSIGGYPKTDSDLEAWLNEGFTEAMTARVLLSSGLWSPGDFVADENTSLLRYGVSPVKAEPNRRILADRHRDFDVEKLPYDRGRLLALLWDYELRARTGGRVGLVDVLRAQIRDAASHPEGPSADQLFPLMVKRAAGVDLEEEISRYVDRGEPVELPEDLFGPCARVVYVSQPVFDRGFNLGATLRAHGRLQELEPGGPADRAGLKEGDHILVDETPTRDSRVTLAYRVVEPDGRRRVVRYKPEGSTQVRFQQIELTPLAKQDPARCSAGMARP